MNTNNHDNIQILIRSNEGIDSNQSADKIDTAKLLAKKARNTTNHMVCIIINGQRTHRWDRNGIEGENYWRSVDVDKWEVVGPIRRVVRGG